MKRLIITLCTALMAAVSFAAGAGIKFDEIVHNFGTFDESKGKVT